MGERFAEHREDKGLVSGICKELSKLNEAKMNNPFQKMDK